MSSAACHALAWPLAHICTYASTCSQLFPSDPKACRFATRTYLQLSSLSCSNGVDHPLCCARHQQAHHLLYRSQALKCVVLLKGNCSVMHTSASNHVILNNASYMQQVACQPCKCVLVSRFGHLMKLVQEASALALGSATRVWGVAGVEVQSC